MKMLVLSSFLHLSLSFGCASDVQSFSDETAPEGVGQVEQAIGTPCSSDCDCPIRERCYISGGAEVGVCSGYKVYKPTQIPPCVSDCQCQNHYASPYTYCDYSLTGSYGYGVCLF